MGIDPSIELNFSLPAGNSVIDIFFKKSDAIRIALILGGWFVYASIAESTAYRGTLGKYISKINVVSEGGKQLSFGQSLLRNASKVFSLCLVGIGIFWMLLNPEGMTWHDLIAKTKVQNRN